MFRLMIYGFFAASAMFGYSSPIFTPPGDPLLQQRSLEVPVDEIQSEETQVLIDQMFAIAKGERIDLEKRLMVGLAAPQIGVLKRIILVDMGIDSHRKEMGELVAFVNPEILSYSTEQVTLREGCFSVDSRVVGLVPRSEKILIQAFDRYGAPILQEISGYTARIFQHEVDHLNGIRFPDRVGRDGALHWVEEEEIAEYRKTSEIWPHKCTWDQWIQMKNGN